MDLNDFYKQSFKKIVKIYVDRKDNYDGFMEAHEKKMKMINSIQNQNVKDGVFCEYVKVVNDFNERTSLNRLTEDVKNQFIKIHEDRKKVDKVYENFDPNVPSTSKSSFNYVNNK
jgi:hypothetical protein